MRLPLDPALDAEYAPHAVPAPRTTNEGTIREFDDLFTQEYEPMLRLAFLMTGSQEQAEDVVHDSLARVLERWDRIDRPGAYLRTVVVNRSRDVLRRRRRWHRQDLDQHDSEEPEFDYLLDVLDTLNARRRAVVVLRYFEQLTIAEIATELGMHEGTVKSSLHRSLELLRKEIAP